MNPRIKKADANDDHTISIVFTNDEMGLFDLKPFLEKGKYKELKEISNFKRFYLEDGVINWFNELDISPDTVYILSEIINPARNSK